MISQMGGIPVIISVFPPLLVSDFTMPLRGRAVKKQIICAAEKTSRKNVFFFRREILLHKRFSISEERFVLKEKRFFAP